MNLNPIVIKRVLSKKKDFFNGHPNVYQFVLALAMREMQEGDVLEFSYQSGEEKKTVAASLTKADLEFLAELQKMIR